MLTYALLLALAADGSADRRVLTIPRWFTDRPRVEVWTNRGDNVYQRGDRARVYFRADRDAFLTVFRVDTDGRVRVLFPREPWEDSFVRGGREYEIEGTESGYAFYVDDYAGVGYVFAVAASDPFDYAPVAINDHWDYRVIAEGRVRGDPYVALTDLATRIVPEGYEDWDYDIVEYSVERHYDYPRFACYSCHAYASYTYWDPYAHYCSRFRIVIYDDPWYYPYRYPYYGSTGVVIVRPYRPAPRFVFKETGGTARDRDPYVTRTRQQPGEDRRREASAPRGRDAGGLGEIPPPRRRDSGTVADGRDRTTDRRDSDRFGDRREPTGGGDDDRREPASTPATRAQPERGRSPTTGTRSDPRRGDIRETERKGGETGGDTQSSRAQSNRREPERSQAAPARESGRESGRESAREPERSQGRPNDGGGRSNDAPRAAPPRREPERTQPRANDGGGRSNDAPRAAPPRREPERSSTPSRGGGDGGSKPELKRRRPN